ncbi:hypothetical protein ASE70_05670 [Sphingomonas sp. Leaf22]|uniref:hypothetical protein n=1 Tax=Sphingomonas sp. Leaf22 TaxID=1735687 RepID=UPI0006FB3D30|nr:hypothetical protein [Sphingomonas sp. Leaf22]KQM79357.1 hypothetical protein ASE70_05670 [Sphingomonas sp. Leaf22]
MIAAALARIAGARQWLTLIALGIAAAWLYAQWSDVTGERDRLSAFVQTACAAAGADYTAGVATVDGRRIRYPAGQRCHAAIVAAAQFRADTDRATAETLAAAMRDRDTRARSDAAHARAAAEAARAATLRMEAADAKAATTDRVDHDWFAALNDLAGLRADPAPGTGR